MIWSGSETNDWWFLKVTKSIKGVCDEPKIGEFYFFFNVFKTKQGAQYFGM